MALDPETLLSQVPESKQDEILDQLDPSDAERLRAKGYGTPSPVVPDEGPAIVAVRATVTDSSPPTLTGWARLGLAFLGFTLMILCFGIGLLVAAYGGLFVGIGLMLLAPFLLAAAIAAPLMRT